MKTICKVWVGVGKAIVNLVTHSDKQTAANDTQKLVADNGTHINSETALYAWPGALIHGISSSLTIRFARGAMLVNAWFAHLSACTQI